MALGAPRGEPGGLGDADPLQVGRGGDGEGWWGVKSLQLRGYERVHGAPRVWEGNVR